MSAELLLDVPAHHPFGTHHLPYGSFRPRAGGRRRLGARFGEGVLDLAALAEHDGGSSPDVGPALAEALAQAPHLNPVLALGRGAWDDLRGWLTGLVTDRPDDAAGCVHDLAEVEMMLPLVVADYVDFYASEHHATNVGRLFRPGQEPLPAAWKHLPIGYHGRASTVVVSGTDVVRPSGQRRPAGAAPPPYGPSTRLDIEAELAFVVGGATAPGEVVPIEETPDHLFGVALLNDWSARDLQAWEYVPLGPFLGKSFATSLAAWVTPMAALTTARVPLPAQDPPPLPYLRAGADVSYGLDITVEVRLNRTLLSRVPFASMYWSGAQMLAHLASNGAAISDGDLLGSGTISGAAPDQRGSLLELTWGGDEPVTLGLGGDRTFLQDGDTVILTASAPGPEGSTIHLGEVVGTIRPAR